MSNIPAAAMPHAYDHKASKKDDGGRSKKRWRILGYAIGATVVGGTALAILFPRKS